MFYNLGQIARVFPFEQPVGFQGNLFQAIWKYRGRLFALLLGLVLVNGVVSEGGVVVLADLVFLALLAWIIRSIRRLLASRGTEYVIQMETAGVVKGVLAGRNRATIIDLVQRLAVAVSSDSTQPFYQHYGDLYLDNSATTQFHQHGDHTTQQQIFH